jgi:nucleoid-associated protein YgaU
MNVRISCDNPQASVDLLMGEDPPVFGGGYGGFEEVERPKRSPVAEWKSPPARTLEISLLLDGFADDRAVDGELFQLARLASNDGLNAPPKIKVAGDGVPGNGLISWYVTDLVWTPTALNAAGKPCRVGINLSLIEAVADDAIERTTRDRVRLYEVKKGDTLSKIAGEVLGFGGRWRELLAANPKFTRGKKKGKARRSPKDVVEGEKLRIP